MAYPYWHDYEHVKDADVLVFRDGECAVAVDRFGKVLLISKKHGAVIEYVRQYVAKHGGGKIVLMGTFYLESSVGDLINIELIGVRARLVLSYDGHAIRAQARNAKIINVELDGQSRSYRAMYFTGEVKNVRIEKCYIHGFNEASILIGGTDVKNVKVVGCRIENSGGISIAFDGEGGVSIVGNWFENLSSSTYYKDGIMVFKGKDIEIRSNRFVNMPNRAITVVPSSSTDIVEKLRIVDNYIKGTGENGIYVGYRGIIREVIISRNQLSNVYRGIEIVNADEIRGIIVESNEIENVTGAGGIYVSAPHVEIKNNVIRKTCKYGIVVGSKTMVEGNIVEDPGQCGGSSIYDGGIVITGTNNAVRNNKIVNAVYGISEDSGADSNIVEGNIMENVTNRYVKVGASTFIDEYVYDKANLPTSFSVKNKPIVAYDSGSGTYYSCVYTDNGWRCVALS